MVIPRFAVGFTHLPAKTVGVTFTALQHHRRIDLRPTLRFQNGPGAQSPIPGDEIHHRQIQRAIGCRIESRGSPFLILELPVYQPIARGTMRNDVLLADDPCRLHPEWLEHTLPQNVAVELARHRVYQYAEYHISGVTVTPARAGEKIERQSIG